MIFRSEKGLDFYQFLGIPYAESPINDLRFQKPVAKKPWNDILRADRHVQCTQIPLNQVSTHMIEMFCCKSHDFCCNLFQDVDISD